jgi:predicted Zn-dependent peptidase
VRTGIAALVLALTAAPLAAPLAAQDAAQDALPPDPFAAFETHTLGNGLRVWYRQWPGAFFAHLAVVVPAGRDADPPGREQLAHLLEHVLLSDRAGRTEKELARELEERGGRHGAFTTPRNTVFHVVLPAMHTDYGVRWLSDVIAPRNFGDDLARHSMYPVAVETGLARENSADRLLRAFIRHPTLRPTPFWLREFGLDVPEERFTAPAALWSIGGTDLRAFYERWYTPPGLTLVIVGPAPWPAVEPTVSATFGTFPWRPPAPPHQEARLRQGASHRFAWTPGRATASVAVHYRIPQPGALDQLRLAFIEDLLRHRLMQRLRRGDDKAIYAVAVTTILRGDAAALVITAETAAERVADVRAAIAAETARIANAADSTAFYRDRDLLSQRLRLDYASGAAILARTVDRFAGNPHFQTVPALGEYYASVGADSIAAAATRFLHPASTVVHVTRPLPLPWPLLLILALLPVRAATGLYRRLTLRPADMRTISYMTRIRPAATVRAATAAGATALVIGGTRAAIALAELAATSLLAPVDSFAIHAAAAGSLLFAATLAGLAITGAVPHKILVLATEVRLKSRTCRSIAIPAADIQNADTLPGGVRLQLNDGSTRFLPVRDPAALHHAITAIATRATATTTPAMAAGQAPCPQS